MNIRKLSFITLGLLLCGAPHVTAQVIPTNYELTLSGLTTTTYGFLHSAVTCNVTVEPGNPGTVNPRYFIWDDPNNAGRICVHDTGAGSGPIFALPVGSYTAFLTAIVQAGSDRLVSNPSNTVSFSRLVQPAARTGFRVRGAL